MPNWTYNCISADKKWIALVKEKHTDEKGNFDFNTLIPMPKSLEVTSGSMNDVDLYYYISEKDTLTLAQVRKSPYAKLIVNVFNEDWIAEIQRRVREMVDEKNPPDYNMGKQLAENYDKYGHMTWYTWAYDEWGTKWNACNCNFDKNSFSFDTAWASPIPVLKKLAELYPDIPFTVTSEDEDGEVEELKNNNGTLTGLFLPSVTETIWSVKNTALRKLAKGVKKK